MAQGGTKIIFPRLNNPGRQAGSPNQWYKAERTMTQNEYPDVRVTIDRMVENRYCPTGGSKSRQPSQPRATNYSYDWGRSMRVMDGGYRLIFEHHSMPIRTDQMCNLLQSSLTP
ncbi:hypothetical protein Adt_24702 [Abeliophyllum distichum]|uniref:Uncharacterized protein n=1 Tax=Abeliophyllum distichum TaxID=126358 RepID=A0ABD1SEH9_9LAMI